MYLHNFSHIIKRDIKIHIPVCITYIPAQVSIQLLPIKVLVNFAVTCHNLLSLKLHISN